VDALRLLREGELEVRGRLVVSSNAALVGIVSAPAPDPDRPPPDQDRAEDRPTDPATGRPKRLLDALLDGSAPAPGTDVAAVVYKPVAFERPLWDFPDGTLGNREVAAFLVSEATGWGIVPPTVLRDGPAGLGMVQLWIDEDEAIDAWQLVQDDDDRLRPMALFDAVVNNTDRKGSHIVPVRRPAVGDPAARDPAVHLFGVDHGVCFSEDPKLRTVLWAWRSTPIAEPDLVVLRRVRQALDGKLGRDLGSLLATEEIAATRRRLDDLLASGLYPEPDPDWPAVPWPPY
jgi:uncharacterized repeat protein (TIGR03843 family)